MARLASLAFVPAALSLAQSQVVYDNTQHTTLDALGNPYFYRISHEYGDDINLAPGYRHVTRFTFEYYGDIDPAKSPGASLTIRFYENDGKLAYPKVTTSQMPSTLLWESSSVPLVAGYSIVSLDVPAIEVPDRLTWTVEFKGITGSIGDSAGLILADPVSIGASLPVTPGSTPRFGSYYDAWVKNDPAKDDSWSLVVFGVKDGDPKANFFSRVEAVPEPGTWALMLGGTGLLLTVGRRFMR